MFRHDDVMEWFVLMMSFLFFVVLLSGHPHCRPSYSIMDLCRWLSDWCWRSTSANQTSSNNAVTCYLFTANSRKLRWCNVLLWFSFNIFTFNISFIINFNSCSWLRPIWPQRSKGFTTWPPVLRTSWRFYGGNGNTERWRHWYSSSINSSKHHCAR